MAIDDDMLMAFVDGELDDIGRARVERAVAQDPALRRRLEEQQRLRDRLSAHYGPIAEEEVPERFRSMLETNVLPFPAAPPRPARPLWQTLTALAATLVLGLLVGRTLLAPAPAAGPFAVEGGAMVARGDLAEALETQLASAQAQGAATRIGVTFVHNDGRTCRTFDSQAAAGIACRTGADWQVLMTAAGSGPQRSDYRQAGSENLLVQQAAQEMMAGEPHDDAAERRARDSGWRSSTPRR
ncbi:MAG TPA: anti-sigma factor [Allosphingosinicella sp.]|nr:anti-sigma factor [Allosphingosinicella sp.]